MKISTIIGFIWLTGLLAESSHYGLAAASGLTAFLLGMYFLISNAIS